MKTPITLEDPRLTAYALGDLANPEDVATIEAALKESPELQAYVDDIVGLGETLTLEFAEETLPKESNVVRPKRSVWRYVAPLGVAAAIAVVATQFVGISDRDGGSQELAVVAESVADAADPEIDALRGAHEKARSRMHEVAQRHRILDTELAVNERPELPEGSVISVPVSPMEKSLEESGVSRTEMLRQLTEYGDAKNEYEQLSTLLATASETSAGKDILAQMAEPTGLVTNVVPGDITNDYINAESKLASLGQKSGLDESMFELTELRKQNEEAKATVDELARRYRIVDLAHLPSDQAMEIAKTAVEPKRIDLPDPEDAPEHLFGWAAEPYQTIMEEATEDSLHEVEVDAPTRLADERRKFKEYWEAKQVYDRTSTALLAAEGSGSGSRKLNADGDFKAGFGIGMEETGEPQLAMVGTGAHSTTARETSARSIKARAANPSAARRVIPSPRTKRVIVPPPTLADATEAHSRRGRTDYLSSLAISVTQESYAPTSDNAFKKIVNPGDERATFSTDVDTASYSNVRRFLTNGQLPPKDAVRVEEMINYFHYDYPQPEGEHPFSVNLEVNEAPWKSGHRLLRIGLKARDVMVDQRPDSNLVFLVDVSGSMNSYDKLALLKKSLKAMVGGLTERDLISFVTYAGQSKVHLPPTPGHETGRLLAAIDQLQSGGSTNGASGIQMAYEQASKHRMDNGVNRVLLATDGDFNVGVTSTDELVAMAKKRAKEDQVFLTVLGFGQGNVKDDRMEQLANKVDGSYHYIDTEREGRKVLVDEMSATLVPIAKDVKIQVEFNPAKVKSYRLIGYANRLLANRDFTDDKKDAGDMGAGHTVTAFYEIVPTGYQSLGQNAAPLKYRSAKVVEPDPVGVSEDLVTVRLRYKQPKEETSQEFETALRDEGQGWNQASEDFRFATSVAAFGMILRQSPYCKASLATVRDWVKGSVAGDEYGWRAECVQLIERAMQF